LSGRGRAGGPVLAPLLLLLLLLPLTGAGAGAPERIASLNLTSDEILVDLVPPERLVAVTAVADEGESSNVAGRLPPGAARFRRAELERLLTLHPDLVVVSQYTDADFLTLLGRSGLRYQRMDSLESLEGIRRAVLDLGRAVNEPARAASVVGNFDRVLSALGRLLEGAPRPRVLYWMDPMTAGSDTVISDVIEAAGARNVGKELGVRGVLPVGTERVLVSDPDYVLIASAPLARKALDSDPVLSTLRAVKEGRVVALPERLLVTLSPYAARTAWELGHALHPDRVPASPP
jgi:iron complex transport system substrate-binding protein